MKTLILLALTSILTVSCSTSAPKRIPASLSEIEGRSIPENSFTKTLSVSFAIKEQGVKLSESSSSTMNAPAGRYTAEIEGVSSGEILAASGEYTVEFKQGNDAVVRKKPGRTTYANVTLERKYNGKSEWQEWYKKVLAGETDRKSVSIIIHDRSGDEVSINLSGALAVSWKASKLNDGSDKGAIEKIELAVEKIERAQ